MIRHKLAMVFASMVLCAGALGAQRPRMQRTLDPGIWVSGSVAGFSANGVNDGRTDSAWDFGNATNWQYRGSVEKTVGRGNSFGVAGSYAHIPFVYSSGINPLPGGTTGTRCAACDAHLDMMTLVATFHGGGSYGFHQVIEFSGGIVAYRNLKRDSDGAQLAPGGGNIDPLFSLGYGIGYGFNERTSFEFVPEYGIAIHERSGLANGVSNTNRLSALRLSVRFGFGGRAFR
ncbi:MAG: hypothetical protein ABR585_06475 [Gemmatimonadaceae bacterium]